MKLDLERSIRPRRGRSQREKKEALRGVRSYNEGPEYLKDFYYVTSLDRLSRVGRSCKLCDFLNQTTPDSSRSICKLLAICSGESCLFEAPKRDSRGRLERRPWDKIDHNVLGVAPEVPGIPRPESR